MERGKLIFSLVVHLTLSLSITKSVVGTIPTTLCQGKPEELRHRKDCVCNSQTLVNYFSDAIRISPTMKLQAASVISQRTALHFCHEFIQLPSHLEIEMTDSVPSPFYRRRYRHRKRLRVKRQISLGFPTESKWQEIIPHLPKYGRHYYAPVGSTVTLRCYLGHNEESQPGVQDLVDDASRTFVWTHANGMEITAPYVATDKTNGDLTFYSVRISDTGIYNCSMSENEDRDGRTYQSQLDVVAGPTYWLRFGMTFKISRCRHKELLEIQRNVPILVHKYACHFCSVMNVSMTCIGLGGDGGGSGDDNIVQLTLAMSALGFEDLLPDWKHHHVHCNLECQELVHAKVLEVTGESLVKLFSLSIHVLPIDGETSVYTAIPESYDEDLTDGCPPGFSLQYSLCFPCPPGRFSPSGPADCFPCAKGFFQPNPGSSACFHCPKSHTTMKRGSLSQMDCILESASFWVQFFNENMILLVWIGLVVLLLVFLIILIICCWPNSAIGRFLRCVSCCGEEGCCGGGENVEKEIMDERENLLVTDATSTTELDSESDDEIRPKRRQTRIYQNESHKSYRGVDRGDFRPSEGNERDNVELSIEHEQIKTKSRNPFSKIKRLDLSKYRLTKPILPRPRNEGRCQTTIKNLQQQEYEQEEEETDEQPLLQENQEDEEEYSPQPPPPLSFREGEETSESSGTRTFFSRNPHLKLGNVLRKSKSLMTKLAEQRQKLRQYQRRSRHESKLPSGAASLPTLKNRMKDSKMVKISESRNTFHPPCRQCTSEEFRKEKEKEERGRNKNKLTKLISRSNSAIDNFRKRSGERVKNTMEKFRRKIVSKKR